VLAVAFALFAANAVWLRGVPSDGSALVPLLLTAAVVVVIGLVQAKRMRSVTEALSSVSAEVTREGVALESSSGRRVIEPAQVRQVVLFRAPFSETVAYVGLRLEGGVAVLPPLEDNGAFASDLRAAMPHVEQVKKRKLLLYAGL
jgi:hypothetical protein